MSNAAVLNFIATGHALNHAHKKEAWFCDCFACRFTKEYKFPVHKKDGTIVLATVADSLLQSLEEQGYHTFIS